MDDETVRRDGGTARPAPYYRSLRQVPGLVTGPAVPASGEALARARRRALAAAVVMLPVAWYLPGWFVELVRGRVEPALVGPDLMDALGIVLGYLGTALLVAGRPARRVLLTAVTFSVLALPWWSVVMEQLGSMSALDAALARLGYLGSSPFLAWQSVAWDVAVLLWAWAAWTLPRPASGSGGAGSEGGE